jgi:hypothetical protein
MVWIIPDLPVDVYAEKYKPTFENMVWLMFFNHTSNLWDRIRFIDSERLYLHGSSAKCNGFSKLETTTLKNC